MSRSAEELSVQLDEMLKRWRDLQGSRDFEPRLLIDSIKLLAKVVTAPLGALDDLLDRGLALAGFIRAVSDLNHNDVVEARICFAGIQEADVSVRIPVSGFNCSLNHYAFLQRME